MAGTLPGVEAARRRRFRQGGGSGCGNGLPSLHSSGGGGSGFSRRPTFCLYVSGTQTQLISSFTSKRNEGRGMTRTNQDVKLGQLAREAKERLDERLLKTQPKLETRRDITDERSSLRYAIPGDKARTIHELQTEVFGSTTTTRKKNKRMSTMKRTWEKLGVGRWKTAAGEEQEEEEQQEECSICLDSFSDGEILVNLPCAHRFHSCCLLPWLQTNSQSHCPCCRTLIFS